MNSQSVPTHLITTLIGVVITLVLLISILYAIRRHFSLECFNGLCNRIVEENGDVDHEMDEIVTIR